MKESAERLEWLALVGEILVQLDFFICLVVYKSIDKTNPTLFESLNTPVIPYTELVKTRLIF